jgi:pyridoxine 5-phosphate synthase
MKRKLGVNIDHIATIRNARGEGYPDILQGAIMAIKSGADSITIHLREDQRHIKENDVILLKKKTQTSDQFRNGDDNQNDKFC